MNQKSVVVSKVFRDRLLAEYPNLKNNIKYLRLAQHLLYSPFKDKENGGTIVSRDIIAWCLGCEASHARAKSFLDAFSRDIWSVEYSQYEYRDNKARTVIAMSVTQDILDAVNDDLLSRDNQVELVSGKTVNSVYKRQIDVQDKQQALMSMALAKNETARDLLKYLSTHSFMTKIPDDLYDKAIELIIAREISQDAKNRMLLTLKNVSVQGKTYYKPVEKSCRLFPANDSILSLPKEIRQLMCTGLIGADLRSCQMAVISKIWNIPSLYRFLSSGRSIWGLFFTDFHIVDKENFKIKLKKCLYSIVFGMSRAHLVNGHPDKTYNWRGIDIEFEGHGVNSDIFLSHPMVKVILSARNRMFALIKKNRGAYDAWNEFIPLTDLVSESSIMAQVAQSYEMRLIEPVLRVCELTNEVQLVYYLFDGCYLHIRQGERTDLWVERIQDLVYDQACLLGIPTCLDVNFPPLYI